MKKVLIFGMVVVLVVAVGLPAMAAGGRFAGSRTGNCLTGSQLAVSGVVVGERVLGQMAKIKADDGTIYDLGMGPIGFKGIALKDGDKVAVNGVLTQINGDNHLAVLTISVNDGAKITLREIGSRPQWAGNGMNRGNGSGGACGTCPYTDND